MKPTTAVTVAVLWLVAFFRAISPRAVEPAPGRALPGLPAAVENEPGRRLPLASSDRLLAASPAVSLERRRYGATEVALLSSSGLKELHPPEVCLRAAGLEVVERGEEQAGPGCVAWLRVRDNRSTPERQDRTFSYVFFDGRTVTCKFWRRALLATAQQLAGRPARWVTLQVMDADRGRARRRLLRLLDTQLSFASPRTGGPS